MRIVCALLVAIFAMPNPVIAQRTSLSAFANYQNLGDKGNDLGWTRVSANLKFNEFQFDFELEFQGLDDPKPLEWINQGRLIYRPNKRTAIMFGRNFRAFGYSTFAPVLLKTAKYPGGYPFTEYYAYGVRVDRKIKVGKLGEWDTKVDLTAVPTGFRKFDFSKPQISFVANHGHGNLSSGFAGQFSPEFARAGVHVEATVHSFVFSSAIFGNSDQVRRWSGLVLIEPKAWKGITPHLQFYSSPKGEKNRTFGITAIQKIGRAELKAIIDCNGHNLDFRTQIYVR